MHDTQHATTDDTPFLTETQLALRWGMSTTTLRNWRSQKKGPTFTKIGRTVRYPIEAVRAFEREGVQ